MSNTQQIVHGLRMGAGLWDSSPDELPRMTSHSRWLLKAAADEIERMRKALSEIEDWADRGGEHATRNMARVALAAGCQAIGD